MVTFRQAWTVPACALAVACSTDHALGPPTTTPVPPPIRNAPAEVSLAGVALRLETYLWRDFQPTSPVDGKPLVAVLRVRSVTGTAISATIHADSAWIINGDLAWATAVVDEQGRASGASFFEVVARDGPKWGPGIQVDVVVRLHDSAGHDVLLRAPNQWINRTD